MRAIWLDVCQDASPYEFHPQLYNPVRDTMTQEIAEIEYAGRRIVATKYTGAFDKHDTLGFEVPIAFVVLDAFDEPALPLVQQWFWSPWDARNAIDFVDWMMPRVAKDKKNWPTTVAYEYNVMTAYRRNFNKVFEAIRNVELLCHEAKDFEEDVTDSVRKRFKLLRQMVAEGGA